MLKSRIFLSVAILLVLVACSAIPGEISTLQLQTEKPDSGQVIKSAPTTFPEKPSDLANSVLAGYWKSDLEGHLLVPIDPSTGQVLPDYEPVSLGQSYSYAFSPDGHTLGVVGYVSSEYRHGGNLHLLNLETWEDHVQELRLDAYINAMDFSPDGKHLAIAYGNRESRILILKVAEPFVKSKSAVQQATMDFIVNDMQFTADSSGLMIYGYKTENPSTVNQMNPEPPIIALLDSTELSVNWIEDLDGVRHGIVPKDENRDKKVDLLQPGQAFYFFPGLAFAPDQDILYVVHADEDKLTTVDFNAREFNTVEIKSQLSWMERFLSLTAGVAHAKVAEGTVKHVTISPDGEVIYIVGLHSDLNQENNDEWQILENPLGLQVVRLRDGNRTAQYDTDASEISISHDGRYLLLQGWDQTQGSAWTQIFDTETNQLINRMEPNTWLVPTHRLNRRPILVSSVYENGESEHHYATVNPDDLSILAEWNSTDYLVWLKMP